MTTNQINQDHFVNSNPYYFSHFTTTPHYSLPIHSINRNFQRSISTSTKLTKQPQITPHSPLVEPTQNLAITLHIKQNPTLRYLCFEELYTE